jgi:hypothetical protein
VCGCHRGGWKCDQDCVEEALIEDSLFYPIGTVRQIYEHHQLTQVILDAQNLYNNLTYIYPEANIWIIGHSLGGGLASLLGVTFGAPVVAFETSGDKLAAERLHLPSPVGFESDILPCDALADLVPYEISLRPTMLHTCIIRLTRFHKAFARACCRHAPLVDTPWKLGGFPTALLRLSF